MTLAARQPDDDAAEEAGVGGLLLRLDGFAGSIDLLLDLARSHQIDLKTLDLLAVIEQLIQATRSDNDFPLSLKAAWTVTAAWLLLLRSHLMLPLADPRQPVAAEQARQLQAQLLSVQEARAIAQWLQARPQIGRDVFERGVPEEDIAPRSVLEPLDRVEFLWACIALFEGDWSRAELERPTVYAPRRPDLYAVDEARDRIRQLMHDALPDARISLAELLPARERNRGPAERAQPELRTRHRSAWSSTLMACLELAKQGELLVEEAERDAGLPAFRGR